MSNIYIKPFFVCESPSVSISIARPAHPSPTAPVPWCLSHPLLIISLILRNGSTPSPMRSLVKLPKDNHVRISTSRPMKLRFKMREAQAKCNSPLSPRDFVGCRMFWRKSWILIRASPSISKTWSISSEIICRLTWLWRSNIRFLTSFRDTANHKSNNNEQVRKREPDPKDPRVRPPSNFVHVGPSCLQSYDTYAWAETYSSRCLTDGSRIKGSLQLSREGEHCSPRALPLIEVKKIPRNRIVGNCCRLTRLCCSLWRPLVSPLHDYPLAVCDASTVEAEDLVESDYVYPNFESESLLVKRSVNHNWYYMSEQTKDELLIITNFDSLTGNCQWTLLGLEIPRRSGGVRHWLRLTKSTSIGVPHSGFELPPSACPSESFPLRQSLEIKVVVYNK